jgi:PAS domain S-box-containing protein
MASAIENARLFEYVAQAEQELENIFESISDLVFFNGADYRIRKVNKAVLEKIGKPAEEIVGRMCYEVFHGMHEPSGRCPHHKTILTHKSYIEELEEPYLGGTYLFSSSPLFDKAGNLLGTVHVARDISELEKLRERVIASERMAALGEMAAKVAHEIRNPLLSIGGFARRIEKRLDGDLSENAKIIVDEVKRLEGILNNTLAFVRTERLDKKNVDVEELISNVLGLCEPAVLEKGNQILKKVTEPFSLFIDYDKSKQALLNIVTNANQATEKGTISVSAYAATMLSDPDSSGRTTEKRKAIIEIADNGSGIAEEDLPRIFDPFFTTRPTGTGLGLSITKRIIEEQGGKIEVNSTLGEGTTFRILFPLKEARRENTGS